MAGLQKVETAYQRFGSMINTVLIIAAFLGFFLKAGGWVERVEGDIRTNAAEITRVEKEGDNKRYLLDSDQNKKWSSHEELHKNRLADVKAVEARTDERIKAAETDIRKLSADVSGLNYRMTTSEQQMSGFLQLLKDIQKNTTELSGDMREFKVILQRMEKGQVR